MIRKRRMHSAEQSSDPAAITEPGEGESAPATAIADGDAPAPAHSGSGAGSLRSAHGAQPHGSDSVARPRGADRATNALEAAPASPGAPDGRRTFGSVALAALDWFLRWFPVRVWNRFSRRNGLVLAAGTSDQALFAVFAGLFAAFAVVGLWLGQNPEVVDSLLHGVAGILPGLIRFSDAEVGVLLADDVRRIALGSAGALSLTGILAIVAVLWTATGWITFLRSAIRDIFGLPPAELHFALLKVVDFLAALVFAGMLAVSAVLSTVGTSALGWLFHFIDDSVPTTWLEILTRILSIAIALSVNTFLVGALFLYLADTDLTWKRVLPGAVAGGAALAILQLAAGAVVTRTSLNPLVATFTVLFGLLIWFRLQMIVILLSAAWVAEQAHTEGVAIVERSAEQLAVDEAETAVIAAQVRVRDARGRLRQSTLLTRRRFRREMAQAETGLQIALERLESARLDEQARQRRLLVRRRRPTRGGA